MKHITIFHTDLPPEIRHDPHAKQSAAKLTNHIFRTADRLDMLPPFILDRMDDRIVVREVSRSAEL